MANKPRRASGSCRPLCRLLNSGGGGMLGKEKKRHGLFLNNESLTECHGIDPW